MQDCIGDLMKAVATGSDADIDAYKELMELLEATVRVAAKSPLGLTGAALDRVYDRIFKRVLPDVILASYGTMPATWSMVSDADYETAMDFVFGGREAQYAGLIEKIRTYHDTAGAHSEDLLKATPPPVFSRIPPGL